MANNMANDMANYWLFKSEPYKWSWDDQLKAGAKGTHWDGVRNHLANNNMKAMRIGDLGFFYHSNEGKEIVGMVKVIKEHYPDPSDTSGRFGMVDIAAVASAPSPVTLAQVKADAALQTIPLVTQSRLSVQPVPPDAWAHICKLAGLEPA